MRYDGKESACQCKRYKKCMFSLWVGKITWRRKWQPNSVFLPGESHGQKSLAGQSRGLWRVMTEWLCTHSRYIYNDPAGDVLLWASLSAGTLMTGHIPHSNPESYIYAVAIRDTGSCETWVIEPWELLQLPTMDLVSLHLNWPTARTVRQGNHSSHLILSWVDQHQRWPIAVFECECSVESKETP